MLLKAIRLLTILAVGFSMGAAIGHLLEMPAKLNYSVELWLTLLKTLYPPAFGPIGGTAEGIAVILSITLTFLIRRRGVTFRWTMLACACMISAHAAFWIWVTPVNATMLAATAEALPSNWTSLRNQWEYTHAIRAILQFIALGAIAYSFLVEIPDQINNA